MTSFLLYGFFVTLIFLLFAYILSKLINSKSKKTTPAIKVSPLKRKYEKYYNSMIPRVNQIGDRIIKTKIAGVSFKNDDGSSRQNIISRLDDYSDIKLIPELYEGKTPSVIVVTEDFKQIGFLNQELADDVYIDMVNNRLYVDGFVTSITGLPGETKGVNIELCIYKEVTE